MFYGCSRKFICPFPDAVAKVKKRLYQEGFVIVSELNYKAILQDMLSKQFESYLLLGVIRPSQLYAMLSAQREVGVFLPHNIAIFEQMHNVYVAWLSPASTLPTANNPLLIELAGETDQLLEKIFFELSRSS